jgi:hypothetical protein
MSVAADGVRSRKERQTGAPVVVADPARKDCSDRIGRSFNAARTGRGVTYNEVFDEVCRKFSDHFVASPASRSRDMRPITVKNAHRDLLCNYIDINKLWTLFRGT